MTQADVDRIRRELGFGFTPYKPEPKPAPPVQPTQKAQP